MGFLGKVASTFTESQSYKTLLGFGGKHDSISECTAKESRKF